MRKRLLACIVFCWCLIPAKAGPADGAGVSDAYPYTNFYLSELIRYRPPLTSTVYAKDGSVLAYFYHENRFLVSVKSLPRYVKQAFIAAEDSRFYDHDGVDPQAVFRAAANNYKTGRESQGASTITQQVIKRRLLSTTKSYTRKFKEAFLAFHLEQYLTKEQILYIYLNDIYFGAGAYGVEAAARTYFNKHAGDLSLPEAALLAGLPKAPSQLNPYKAPEKAKQRQQYVLGRMLSENFISRDQHEKALTEPLVYQHMADPTWQLGPYYLTEVHRWLLKHLSREALNPKGIFLPCYGEKALIRGGLHIHTAYDHIHQKAAQEALTHGLDRLTREWEQHRPPPRGPHPPLQGALVSMVPETGEVNALVGGYDYLQSKFNRATQALRQPGSLFKPIVFSAALSRGYTAASVIPDAPFSMDMPDSQTAWEPKNFSETYGGPTLLSTALAQSINVVAARVAKDIGISSIIRQARRMGITSYLPHVPSISLGAGEATLLELVRAYATFPRGGSQIEPRLVLSVFDRDFNLLVQNTPRIVQAMSPQDAYIMTHLLKQTVESGTGWRAKAIGRPVAGKTGTSNDMRDAWFIGFTPSLVSGVFVGFDDGTSLGKEATGSNAAAPIWVDYYQKIKKYYTPGEFEIPEDIHFGTVTPDGTYLGDGWQAGGITLPFKKGTEPENDPETDPGIFNSTIFE